MGDDGLRRDSEPREGLDELGQKGPKIVVGPPFQVEVRPCGPSPGANHLGVGPEFGLNRRLQLVPIDPNLGREIEVDECGQRISVSVAECHVSDAVRPCTTARRLAPPDRSSWAGS